MPDRQAIERGYQFEDRVADVLDLQKTPGSGNKFFAPSDCGGHGLLVSCKSETNLTHAKIRRHLFEAIELAYQSGSIAALALEDADTSEQFVLMRLEDFASALKDVKIPEHFGSPGLEKRAKADVPIMLR